MKITSEPVQEFCIAEFRKGRPKKRQKVYKCYLSPPFRYNDRTTFFCHSDGIFCEMLSFQLPEDIDEKTASVPKRTGTHITVLLKMCV